MQVIDSETHEIIATLEPGPAVLHMEFTARGDQLWLSVRDGNEVRVWDLQPEADQAPAGTEPERLLQQPRSRDGVVTCTSTLSVAA